MFCRLDDADSMCTSQGCSCLVEPGRVEREELHRKGGTKRIKMTSKEINNFEARRHDTLPKEGENVCDPSLCLNSGIVLITVTSYHITCINCHKNNFPCDISGC